MRKKKKPILVIIFVILFLLAVVFGAIYYYEFNKIVAIVTMDINPSVSLGLNKMGKVIKAEGINDDGKKLLEDNMLKGKSLEIAINNISDLVIDNGYFSNENNHILVNIEGEDIKEDVSKILTDEIKEKNIECEIIFQELSDSSKENASKYGISENKASYIEDVIKENNDVTFEDLKDKSINEINKFIEEKKEENKKEEDKKPITNSGTNNGTTNNNSGSGNINTKPNTSVTPSKPSTGTTTTKPSTNTGSSSGSTGTINVCKSAVFNLENDDVGKKAFASLGLDFGMNMSYNYQSVAKAYNGICTYEVTFFYNKTMYKFYYNVTDGSLVNKTTSSYVAGNTIDAEEAVINYFINNYGATREQVNVYSVSGGILNEPTYNVGVKYNDVTYFLDLDKRTGTVKSIRQV